MRRIVNFTGVVLALGVLAVCLASIAPRSVGAAVAALVHVDNFPAMQPVSGSVDVGNFPATQMVAGTVSVANTPSTPLFNRDVDNGERNVIRLVGFGTMNAGAFGDYVAMQDASAYVDYTVPTGKRLVIDSVSLFAYPPAGQKIFAYLFNGINYTGVPAISHGTFFGSEYYQNGMAVRDYVEPGNLYYVSMSRSASTGQMFWDVNAVGHLVACTNGGGC